MGAISTIKLLLSAALLHSIVDCRLSFAVKRPSDLLPEYDFIVVGAGTTGLTVADRLTESGNYTVLVVEYGYLDDDPALLQAGGRRPWVLPPPNSPVNYNLTVVPIPMLNNQTPNIMAGAVVGGSSAVNGMALNRGSKGDYDAWIDVVGPRHRAAYAQEWGWDNLFPCFKKSVTLHPPSPELANKEEITWDVAAYGQTTPLHASFAPFSWPARRVFWDILKAVLPELPVPREAGFGQGAGLVWSPSAVDPATYTRSYSRTVHYDRVLGSRHECYHLLPGWRVTQLMMAEEGGQGEWAATGVLVTPRDGEMPDGGPIRIRARREIIVSAGSIHTPQVLQRSGIGPRDVIEAAGGTVRVELPGVGANLQDHMHFPVNFTWTTPVLPWSGNLTNNATYADEMFAVWEQNRTGPYTQKGQNFAFIPFPIFTSSLFATDMASTIAAQDPSAHLPPGTHSTVVAGFAQQLRVLAGLYNTTNTAVLEWPVTGNGLMYPILLKPLSRGRVTLHPNDDGVSPAGPGAMTPRVEYRTRSNPVDQAVNAASLRFIRRMVNGEAISSIFHPIEEMPGIAVQSDEEISAYVGRLGQPGNGHPSSTAAIGPRELGGVVGPDLSVHGVARLSVADCSVFTLIPGSHTSAPAYAIGEKAATMILWRARNATQVERC